MAWLMTTEQWMLTVEFGNGVSSVTITNNKKIVQLAYKALVKALDPTVADDKLSFFEFDSNTRTTSFRLDSVVFVDLQKK